jgi:hypothetical protein
MPPDAKTQVHVMCPDVLFMETVWGHPSMKNTASTFGMPDEPECICGTQIPPDVKTQVQRNVSQHAFCHIHIGPTRA